MTQRKPLVACVRNALMLSMASTLAFAGTAAAQDSPPPTAGSQDP